MKIIRNATLAIALASVAVIGATAITGSAVRPGNWFTAVAYAPVPLAFGGATTLTIVPGSAGRRVLTYSAACAVDAPAGNRTAYVDLDIAVNGIVVTPTSGGADAFCTADGTPGFSGWTRASITVPINVDAGANSIRIFAGLNSGALRASLGDSSLVVHQ